MLFAIYCLDNPDTPDLRNRFYDEHRAYLASQQHVRILVAGPLLSDDQQRKIGSLLIVEGEGLENAQRFNRDDPFNANKVWHDISIHHYVKATDNR